MMYSILDSFYDSISELLNGNVNKSLILENWKFAMLVIDEMCDNG